MNVLVTGGCGFIGSNLVKYLRRVRPDWTLVNLDKLTYAGNLENLKELEGDSQHVFVRGDVANRELVEHLMGVHRIDAVMHLAAESHVDRSGRRWPGGPLASQDAHDAPSLYPRIACYTRSPLTA